MPALFWVIWILDDRQKARVTCLGLLNRLLNILQKSFQNEVNRIEG